jgi:hypothetical protein
MSSSDEDDFVWVPSPAARRKGGGGAGGEGGDSPQIDSVLLCEGYVGPVGPPLFVNSDTFVNTARLHTHVPLECSWYDSY